MQRILLVGAGTIGTSWATFFLARGLDVILHDVEPARLESARARIAGQLAQLVQAGLAPASCEGAGPRELMSRLTTTVDLEQGRSAQFVQESGPEDYDVKGAIFARLDEIVDPSVPVATSSSGLLISRLQERTRYPGRYLVAHPFNPPHLIPLVELVPGPATAPQVLATVRAAFEGWGKTPVTLKKEVPGHIANRLAAALWREAVSLVIQGVADVADVDRALSAGPGLRWSIMGAHLTYHLGGGDGGLQQFWRHLGPAFETYFADLSSLTHVPPEAIAEIEQGLKQMIGDASVAELARWRDERLIRVLKALAADDAGPDAAPGSQRGQASL